MVVLLRPASGQTGDFVARIEGFRLFSKEPIGHARYGHVLGRQRTERRERAAPLAGRCSMTARGCIRALGPGASRRWVTNHGG